MKRAITLACLVVLAIGIGTLLYADAQKVVDPRCGSSAYTTGDFYCPTCDEWYIEPVWSDDGSPPPYDEECPYCHLATNPAQTCGCSNPLCVGGVFWTKE